MVKITFKTVQNKLFTVDADDSETVADLKKKIQETQTFPVENQKLIFSGKILQDAATVSSLKIKEKDFLVVMVSKPKAAAPAPSTPAPAPAPAASTSTAETPAATSEAPSTSAPAATETPATSAPEASAPNQSGNVEFGNGGSFVSGAQLESAIAGMVEMGFEHGQVVKALRAAFNNPDRAVEYLMSGNIPNVEGSAAPRPPAPAAAAPTPAPTAPAPAAAAPSAPAPAPTPATAPSAAAPGGSAENLFAAAEAAMIRDRGIPAGGAGAAGGLGGLAGLGGAAGAGGGGDLAELANAPHMQRIRQMVQQNPELIQPLLQQIASQNPQLAQLINQHPEALYELLGGAPGDEGEEDFGGPQIMQVDLTQEEAAAVGRLEALGFDRQVVLQAYMLCDKNEELAANFLFENGEDD